METYTLYFRSDLQWGRRNLKAETPEQAVAQARRLAKDKRDTLNLDYFEACDCPINAIEVYDRRHNSVAVWFDEDMRLRLAARSLLTAAELVIARWEQGDLAEAVRELDAAIMTAREGAA